MIHIVNQVEGLIASQVYPGKIAVIYKENKYGEELLSYFKRKNIPVYSKRNINLLDDPLIGQLLLLIRYLASAHEHEVPFNGDEMLFEILHAEWFHIPAIEIATMTAEAYKEKISLRRLLNDKANRAAAGSFLPWSASPAGIRGQSPGIADQRGLQQNASVPVGKYISWKPACCSLPCSIRRNEKSWIT